MTRSYAAKRRDFAASTNRPYFHHAAWGVICVLLIATVMSLWAYAQSLVAQNVALQRQLILAQRPETPTCKVSGEWRPNTTTVRSVADRKYLVHTPATFERDSYYPLILFYPGKGATAEAAQLAYGLDALPAIMIYPYPTTSTDGFPSWQGAPYSSGSDDVAFTQAVINNTQDELCIDRTRLYAAGMSNGGGFVSMLSCRMADKFAAYAVISGAMYAPHDSCKPSRATPIISVHGDKDPTVPYAGSVVRRLPAVESWAAKRAALNGCASHVTANQGITLAVTTWNGCRDGATVQSIRVIGGGHAWGDVPNDTLWQFLSRFSR